MPQVTNRPTFAQGSAKPAPINFAQFGQPLPNISQFNTSGGLPFPNLPTGGGFTPIGGGGDAGGFDGFSPLEDFRGGLPDLFNNPWFLQYPGALQFGNLPLTSSEMQGLMS